MSNASEAASVCALIIGIGILLVTAAAWRDRRRPAHLTHSTKTDLALVYSGLAAFMLGLAWVVMLVMTAGEAATFILKKAPLVINTIFFAFYFLAGVVLFQTGAPLMRQYSLTKRTGTSSLRLAAFSRVLVLASGAIIVLAIFVVHTVVINFLKG